MNLPDELVEAGSEEVYRLLPYDEPQGEKPAWHERGNSLKQDEARRYVRAALEAALPLVAKQMMEPSMEMTTFGKHNGEDAFNEVMETKYRMCGCPNCDEDAHRTFGAIWKAMARAHFSETYNLTLDGE